MRVGDMVKMKRGYSMPGLILEITETVPRTAVWVKVLWPDYGPGLEKERDLEVINESR